MPLTGPAYGLQGTLDMMSGLPVVRSQQEADEALAAIQRDQAARQAAEASAFSAFQGAQGQAPPAPTALDALPQFFSNIASIASQRPEFAERRQQSTTQQRAELLARRQENLRTLEGRYQDLAKQAQEIDPVKALEYQEKVGKLHKEQEKLIEMQKQSDIDTREQTKRDFEAEQNRLSRVSSEKIANIKSSSSSTTMEGVDAEAIAEGIRNGNLPPVGVNLGRGGTWAKVVTSLSKSGYKLAKAQQEWQAVQRHIATLNGRQQLQIRTSAETVNDALDNIDALSARLSTLVPRTSSTLLNKGINLSAREWGALGPEAQEVATQLRSQAADIIPELANIYMAGGVPTDRALKLARETLNENMAPNALRAQTKLARTNLGYRINAIKNAMPITGQGGEVLPSATPTPEAPTQPRIIVVNPKGQRYEIDASELPEAIKRGWKRAK